MKTVVFSGHQPNFLPYMGYFYKMFMSDIFVLDDDVQYSNNAYHNTNFIKVNGKKFRVTVPVAYKFGDLINEVRICYERDWDRKLLKTLEMNYGKAPFFEEGYSLVEQHLHKKHEFLFGLNYGLIMEIAARFKIGCKVVVASKDVPTDLKGHERNVHQCIALGGDAYYSGTGGRAYNDEQDYEDHGICLMYSDYKPVTYSQVGRGFIENLSVLDYIFNNGFRLPEEWRPR